MLDLPLGKDTEGPRQGSLHQVLKFYAMLLKVSPPHVEILAAPMTTIESINNMLTHKR